MSELAMIGSILLVSIIAAWALSIRYHSESRTLESAVRLPMNLTWVMIGFFTILAGYYKVGTLVFIAGLYFFIANTRRIRDSDVSMSPGGWRQKVGNWNPYDRSG